MDRKRGAKVVSMLMSRTVIDRITRRFFALSCLNIVGFIRPPKIAQTPARPHFQGNRRLVYFEKPPKSWQLFLAAKAKAQRRIRQMRVIVLRSRANKRTLVVVVILISNVPVQ